MCIYGKFLYKTILSHYNIGDSSLIKVKERGREMKVIRAALENLYLDPNNYRLRGNLNYKNVEDKNICNSMVQKRVMKMIKGENTADIKDLLESFKENGYLKIDNIIVRPLDDSGERYLVVEGNRRITTLKVLKELYEDGMDIGKVNPECFDNLDVVEYNVDDKEYEILMGLRHVSGVRQWGDYEQSELVANLVRRHNMELRDISESLGIATKNVKRRLNTYYALEIFRNDSEYGEYFAPNKLSSIFYEIMGKPEMRDQWLGWDENLNSFQNKENMRRLFSWLVPYEDDNGRILEPIVTKRDEIREIVKFVMDEQALEKLEESRNVTEAREESEYCSKEGLKNNLKQITRILNKFNLGTLTRLEDKDKEIIEKTIDHMETQGKLIKKLIESL